MEHPYTKTRKGHLAYAALWVAMGALAASFPFIAVDHAMPKAYYLVAGGAMGFVGITSFFSASLRRYLQRQYYGASRVGDSGSSKTEAISSQPHSTLLDTGNMPLWKKRIVFFVLTTVLLLLACSWIWRWTRNVVLVENDSGLTAKVVTVSVCGRNYRIEDLPDGSDKEVFFSITSDSHLAVAVSMADGSMRRVNFGYVTAGAGAHGNRVRINISKDGISGEQSL